VSEKSTRTSFWQIFCHPALNFFEIRAYVCKNLPWLAKNLLKNLHTWIFQTRPNRHTKRNLALLYSEISIIPSFIMLETTEKEKAAPEKILIIK